MKTLNLGLLLPTSSIIPMGKQFERGLKETFSVKSPGANIEITKEFIGQGSVTQTQNSINKFFNYDEVDVVTGILSNKLAENFSSLFQKQRKPFIINNLGENIPDPDQLNAFTLTSSFGFWQHAWTLGYWGVKTFGKKGMYISSVYDAGYSFSHMFYEGMKAADAGCEWSFSIAPVHVPGELSDLSVIFPYLEQYQPDFVFATFCGAETTIFINEFIARGWHKRTQLLGLPFLLEPFMPVNGDMKIYTTSPSIIHPSLKASDCFYYLGQQTAEVICNALNKGADSSIDIRKEDSLQGLANTFFWEHSTNREGNVAIFKNEIVAGSATFASELAAEVPTFPLKQLAAMERTTLIGWNNPYLCV